MFSEQAARAKVLSNSIKQKRKEKAGKWEVPLPKASRDPFTNHANLNFKTPYSWGSVLRKASSLRMTVPRLSMEGALFRRAGGLSCWLCSADSDYQACSSVSDWSKLCFHLLRSDILTSAYQKWPGAPDIRTSNLWH